MTEVTYEGGGIRGDTRISDISTTGVFIDALTPLPAGSLVTLRFTLPGGHIVETSGKVVQSQPRIGMGVVFTSLSPEDENRIRETVGSSS
jgi:hypothetical protein